MNTIRIAVPSQNSAGMASLRSEHFGQCELFTLVDISEGNITKIQTVDNVAHGAGGCMMPVKLLQASNVDAIIVSGMGGRPLQGFANAGIKVLYAPKQPYRDVSALIEAMGRDEFTVMNEKQACTGHGKCHHHG